MRRVAFFIAFIIAVNASAQIPDYFANDPNWRINSDCMESPPCLEKTKFVYYINGDSVVDGKTYKKLYMRGELDHFWYDSPPVPPECDTGWSFNQFYALVRQEGRKIFASIWNEPESLLYDFDLKVGDSLPVTWNHQNENYYVESIDSLLVGSEYRKVFNLNGYMQEKLVEGIGHDEGFIEPFPPFFDCGYDLICFTLGDTTYYPAFGDPCDLSVDITERKINFAVGVHPNPFRTSTTIEYTLEQPETVRITFYNQFGKQVDLIEENQPKGQNKIVWKPKNLPDGIYYLTLQVGNNLTTNRKLILMK